MRPHSTRLFILILTICLALSACQGGSSASTTPEATPGPTATATPEPRLLTICLGQEPSSLYMYGNSSRSMWSVLEALYDGPIDYRNFTAQPVILNSIPSLDNGGAVLQPVEVQSGEIVANIDGNAVALAEGVTVFPSGCTDQSCAITWDGVTPLTLDQMVATYTLQPGINWSDGTPLTAADSVYSFQVSADPDTPVTKTAIQRTASYTAIDDLTIQWTGIPGYLTTSLGDYYWVPLPQHQLSSLTAADLLTSALTTQTPLGWGPYVIDEWTTGDHIRMVKNPAYFRAGEGLPYFDTLVFRFLGEQSDTNLAALLAGECDIVDQYSYLEDQPQTVRDLELNGDILVYRGLGPGWETLDFGIVPAAYDDGFNPFGVDRANIFGDVRTRQAFAYCLDRADMVTRLYNNLTQVANGYLPPSHPLYLSDLAAWPYDAEAGATLLEQIGWRDFDNDPATPRVAAGISGVPDGTLLSVTLTTSTAQLRQ
ncbi:MAG TPA: ABC transporter substrate-binding protein, partial [Longilinea sp.]|nr:ABC transporter substrate-binding protein [Longilinea sp.]